MNPFDGFQLPDYRSRIPQIESTINEEVLNVRTPFNAGGELFFEALEGWVRGTESRLEEDQALVVMNHQGASPMRVSDVAYPSARTLVLVGEDPDGNEMHVFSHVSAVQVELQIVSRRPKNGEEARARIGFHNLMETQNSDEGSE